MNSTLNSKFQEDYKKYSEAILKIDDPILQKETQSILDSLSTRVKNIEKIHSELIVGNPSALDDVGSERKKIIELRKLLDKQLKKI